ncbi:class I SAM-dependent methyltransferase [Iodobacter sp. HSC-16F04]|uniref:Class I SAM-dependent methyltransferase n=1 Tax=Iodobacter violaceini TaxID=3044271 RepID=A0ABX0KM97_9NEIS|nr:class I SAM-dependent methyltransferase [Iodobacter violacea]NHQ85460.1 class I SAM-dependent methyltransferase [Iodobacter violacea]
MTPHAALLPHMPQAECEALTAALTSTQSYVEYGMGGSTVLAAQLGVPRIVAIDSSEEWLAKVREQIAPLQSPSQIKLLHAPIGETMDWGFPENTQMQSQWPDYYSQPWRFALDVDLVLIDGRFRVPCFLYSLLQLQPGAIILWDDYAERCEYHLVEQQLVPEACFGKMAKFIVPCHKNTEKIVNALFQHLYAVA